MSMGIPPDGVGGRGLGGMGGRVPRKGSITEGQSMWGLRSLTGA